MEQSDIVYKNEIMVFDNNQSIFKAHNWGDVLLENTSRKIPEILFVTSYPPRECGIATYSQDLIKALKNKFIGSFKIQVCALETDLEKQKYSDKVSYILNTDEADQFYALAKTINENSAIDMVLIQHEFGLFSGNPIALQLFLEEIIKPIILVFHTILPRPDAQFLQRVQQMVKASEAVIVMTNSSAQILKTDYQIEESKITVIAHGTHLVAQQGKHYLKEKYDLKGKIVLSTFGLLSSGKSIETTLNALPIIIKYNPDVLFLIIGKTHPSVVKQDGEQYRESLKTIIQKLNLQNHVRFVNEFLPLAKLLEYLQLTDIYLFTSKDPNQAVSGTFSYALSCGCPIISTPIPHALEVLKNNIGLMVDFENPEQLSSAVNKLLKSEILRNNMSLNTLHMMAPTAWENSAIAHARLFEKISVEKMNLNYQIPPINLDHIHKMTDDKGMVQFSVIDQPDLNSGYTLDDNSRAMVAMCQHYELFQNKNDLKSIGTYLAFIKFCQQPEGNFLNYVDKHEKFTSQNYETNLNDSNGRAIWALGYLISLQEILPIQFVLDASKIIVKAMAHLHTINSTRAMAFIIKGLYYSNKENPNSETTAFISHFANKILQMYRHEASHQWNWYESYLTYANSIIPEAMLCAYLATHNLAYKIVAKSSFDFLLKKLFNHDRISVISNKNWLQKNADKVEKELGGQQAIDVAYTILALEKFYEVFNEDGYKQKLEQAFSWFLGNNHLHQIMYNPCTGGCYDGLEDVYVNLNQGAESTESYLMARLTVEKSNYKKPFPRKSNISEMILVDRI